MIRPMHDPNFVLRRPQVHPAILLGALTGRARRRLLGDDNSVYDSGNFAGDGTSQAAIDLESQGFSYQNDYGTGGDPFVDSNGDIWTGNYWMSPDPVDLSSSEDLGLGPSDQPSSDSGVSYGVDPNGDFTISQTVTDSSNPLDIFTGLDPSTLFPADTPNDQLNQPAAVSADPSDPNSPLFNPLDIFGGLDPTTVFNPANDSTGQLNQPHPIQQLNQGGGNPGGPPATGGGAGSGAGGSQPQQAKPQPTLQVSVVPPNPQVGQPCSLVWQSQNAQSVLVQGVPSATSGQKQFTASTPQTFVLIAMGPGGQAAQTAYVNPVTHTSSVTPSTAPPAGTSTNPFANLEAWLGQKTLYSKMPNGEVLAIGAAGVLVFGSLLASRGGKRR